MISVYNIKPKFQKLLLPLLAVLRKFGITPNHITIFSILFSFFIGYIFYHAQNNKIFYLLVAIGLIVRMGLNALDGMMANKYNLKSKKGEILNEIGDIISDIAIYFPLLYFDNLIIEYTIFFIVLSVINDKLEKLGIVSKLMETGADDVMVVQGSKQILIPFIMNKVIKKVDLKARHIIVDWEWVD